MKNVTITINAENPNPELGATNVSSAIAWAAEQVAEARTKAANAAIRYTDAMTAWDNAEEPTAEVEAEYEAAYTELKMTEAIAEQYAKLLQTLNTLETDLLHLAWAMDKSNY